MQKSWAKINNVSLLYNLINISNDLATAEFFTQVPIY